MQSPLETMQKGREHSCSTVCWQHVITIGEGPGDQLSVDTGSRFLVLIPMITVVQWYKMTAKLDQKTSQLCAFGGFCLMQDVTSGITVTPLCLVTIMI